MIVGYARVSTVDQDAGLEAKKRDLKNAGCEKTFVEKVSSVAKRPKLEEALEFAREGDTLLVTKVDRLARSMQDLMGIIGRLQAEKVGLKILDMNLDTSTPTGELMLTVLGGIAAFERRMMLERQLEGIAKAKREGKYKGRAPTARTKAADVIRLAATGAPKWKIAEELEIGEASVWRILRDAKNAARASATA